MHLNMPSEKWRLFCPGGDGLRGNSVNVTVTLNMFVLPGRRLQQKQTICNTDFLSKTNLKINPWIRRLGFSKYITSVIIYLIEHDVYVKIQYSTTHMKNMIWI